MTRALCLISVAVLAAAFSATPGVSAAGADAAGADGSPRYSFRYRFHPGETVRWEVVHRKKVDTTISGTAQTTETFSKSVKVWQVGEVQPDGTTTFEQRVEDVDMWHKMGDTNQVRYNSQTDPAPPPGYEQLAESVGVPLSAVTIDVRGQVVKRQWKPVKAVAQNEGQITIPFPDEPIPVGHTWSLPYTIDLHADNGMVKKVKTRQQYTLSDVKTGVATIEVSTQVLTPLDDPALQSQLMQCESRGLVRFDIEAGRIIGQQMDVDRQVVGYPNEASSFHYLSRFTEKLLPAQLETASR